MLPHAAPLVCMRTGAVTGVEQVLLSPSNEFDPGAAKR